jgi:serine phosphatase RsbU (regulator of sigma subunit)
MHQLFKHDKVGAIPSEPVQSLAPSLTGGDLAAMYYGERLGGDFYDFIRVSPTRIVFGLLDVAGRSEHNHAIVAAAKKTFREDAVKLLAPDSVNEADAMSSLCLQLNRTVLESAGEIRSCPAFAACYNENLGVLCYFNAGHTPALLRDSTGVTELPATGLPLGLFSHATCDAPMAALTAPAGLLLVSRGVVEAKQKGEEFGLDGAKQTLSNSPLNNARDLCRAVIEDVRQFMRTPPTHNDVTALALVRGTGAGTSPA